MTSAPNGRASGRAGYLDFDVHIGERGKDGYLTRVQSPGGEPRSAFALPFSDAQLAEMVGGLATLRESARQHRDVTPARRSDITGDDQLPRTFGSALFTSLLGGSLATAYRVSRDRASRDGKGLRIRLRIDAPEIAALPWELAYDDVDGDFVALSRDTPVVRYLELDRPPPLIPAGVPLRVLGMIALPRDVAQLDAVAERRRIEEELAGLVAKNLVELRWVEGETWRDLQRAMRDEEWNVFHFVGHGSSELEGGSIILADEEGRSAPLASEELGRLLAGRSSLGLVVLNACEGARISRHDLFGSSAATLVRRGLPAAIAMQHAVSDHGAISFARDFYAAIADGLPVDAALSEARIASSLEGRRGAEWATPVLMMRAPDGRLFDLDRRDVESIATSVAAPTADDFPEIPGTSGKGWTMVMIGLGVVLVAYVIFMIAMG